MNEKGLSNIIATVLIVLLALAAVAIVWTVMNNIIGDTSEEISLTNLCVLSEAKPTNCINNTDTEVNVTVQLVRGDNVAKVIGIVTFEGGATASGEAEGPKKLQTNLTKITNTDKKTPLTAKATVVVQDESGNTKTCDEYTTEIQCN